MTAFTGFIDPPGSFADPEEWRAFIEELGRLPQNPEVERAIEDARTHMIRAVAHAPAPVREEEEEEEDDFSDLDGEGGEGGE